MQLGKSTEHKKKNVKVSSRDIIDKTWIMQTWKIKYI